MKSLFCGGIAVGVSNLQALINDVDASMAISSKKVMDIDSTIFCIPGDPEMKEILSKCVRKTGYNVSFGHPDSPELISGQQCISIVDSNIVNQDLWNRYIDVCNKENRNAPCLLTGNNNDLNMSRVNNVRLFEITDNKSINYLYRIIYKVCYRSEGLYEFIDSCGERLTELERKWITNGVFPLEGEIWESINPVEASWADITFMSAGDSIVFPANERMINYGNYFYPLQYHEHEARLIPEKIRNHIAYSGYSIDISGVDMDKHLRPVELANRSTLNWVHSLSAPY